MHTPIRKIFTLFFLSFILLCSATKTTFAQAQPLPFAAGQPITNAQLDQLNPLIQNGDPALAAMLSTPAGVVNRVVVFAFPIAGLILFVMIVWGGFEMLSGATTKKSIDTGKQRITAAFIGFLLLFLAYWIVVIIEAVFGVKIL